jgi:hypothetical protein
LCGNFEVGKLERFVPPRPFTGLVPHLWGEAFAP